MFKLKRPQGIWHFYINRKDFLIHVALNEGGRFACFVFALRKKTSEHREGYLYFSIKLRQWHRFLWHRYQGSWARPIYQRPSNI